ncbi:hypothetical protein Tco_0813053 [Tanacetum coccineum]
MMAQHLDVGSINTPYLLARYLRKFAAERKSGAHISGGKFIARLAKHFGLLTAKILKGLTVIAPELQIWLSCQALCLVGAGATSVAEDAPAIDEGDQNVPAPEDVHELRGALTEQREVIDAMARDFSIFSTWVTTGLGRIMDRT